jgi:hypothetical protein
MKINVTGVLEVDDGRGGLLVYQTPLFGHGDVAQ